MANKSRTDIRLHHPDVKERVPIELKIAGKWRAGQLRERLENQLGHDYLRAARHGVFLVVNRGAQRDKKSWKVVSQKLNFDGLLSWLKDEAQKLLSRQSAIEAIEIVGIDLTIRSKPQVGPERKKTDTKETAHDHGVDESGKEFERAFKKVVPPKKRKRPASTT